MDTTVYPKHEVLSAEEKGKILEQYRISEEEIPRIKKGDPGLDGLSANSGDLIKITRKSATANQAVYYRLVVD